MSDSDTLVVVSKIKKYVKDSAGMNTSGNVPPVLSAYVRRLVDRAVEHARGEGRKTIMDRDFTGLGGE